MADNTRLNAGTDGDLVATDDIGGGLKVQRVKIMLGPDGTNEGDVGSTKALPVRPGAKTVSTIFNTASANQVSSVVSAGGAAKTLQVVLSGTGPVSATVDVYASNVNSTVNAVPLCTFTLTGTTAVVDGTYITADWPYLFAAITGLTGTSAAVTLTVGY